MMSLEDHSDEYHPHRCEPDELQYNIKVVISTEDNPLYC